MRSFIVCRRVQHRYNIFGINEKRFGTLNLRVLPAKIINHHKKYIFV